MRYGCTHRLHERNPKIDAKVPLTSKRPYVEYPIGIQGSGVLGRIAFAGALLVTDPGSPRKHRRNFASLCQPTFPANNRAEVLPAMGWSKKAFRLRVGAQPNGCPSETNALIAVGGEFSRQRASSRSRRGEFYPLRLRPGLYLKSLKALGISGNTVVQGQTYRFEMGSRVSGSVI